MPQYVLGYFNARGRAEVARYLFALKGVEYEDLRFDGDTWRHEHKPKTPFGQAPFLKIDDKTVLGDSGAITRYLAKQFGYMGSSDLDEALINQTLGVVEDVFMRVARIRFVLKDEKEKAEALKEFQAELLPKFLAYIDANINSNGFLVGDKLSLADITAAYMIQFLKCNEMASDKVKKFVCDFENNPKIKEWIAKRPETEN